MVKGSAVAALCVAFLFPFNSSPILTEYHSAFTQESSQKEESDRQVQQTAAATHDQYLFFLLPEMSQTVAFTVPFLAPLSPR